MDTSYNVRPLRPNETTLDWVNAEWVKGTLDDLKASIARTEDAVSRLTAGLAGMSTASAVMNEKLLAGVDVIRRAEAEMSAIESRVNGRISAIESRQAQAETALAKLGEHRARVSLFMVIAGAVAGMLGQWISSTLKQQ